jgi:PAS domain S-box-containing protein
MQFNPPSSLRFGDIRSDLTLLAVFTALGAAISYLSINIPHTEVFLDIRWGFGLIGVVLIKRWPLAYIIPLVLSLTGFHQVPLLVYLPANLLNALPFCFFLRFIYRRITEPVQNVFLFGLIWLAAVVIGYQVIIAPLLWLAIGLINSSLNLQFVLGVFSVQPFLWESVVVGFISSFILIIVRQYLLLRYRERHLSTILHSIGDGVIVADLEGRVELMNPVAERLTGWKREDARKRSVPEVFRIINAHNRRSCENPVEKVLQTGVIVGLANHTVLISRDGREFQIADSGAPVWDGDTMKGVVLVFRDVTEDYMIRERIDRELREKDVLLKEVHHRVKNNLQVIASLLSLQAADSTDTKIKEVFDVSRKRIYSMAMVHNQLYRTENFSQIDFKSYVEELSSGVLSETNQEHEISIEIAVEDVLLGLDTAIPCGLILNELITNSVKHAFIHRRRGKIIIMFRQDKDRHVYVLTYRDNGIGLPEGIELANPVSLGLSLVKNLTDQIDGTLQMVPSDGGLCFQISFPMNKGEV